VDTSRTIELALQELSQELTAPHPGECLSCYLHRMLGEFGCAQHRFTRRWAQGRARGTPDGLVRWASALGGCCCDCEVVMNVLGKRSARRRGGVLCAATREQLDAVDEQVRDGPVPPCSGVPFRRTA
jgi:hypothetical protein